MNDSNPDSAAATTSEIRTLSVLMPVYNEIRTLSTIIERVFAAPIDLEIELICVDDCSSDGSWERLQRLAANDDRIRIHRHEENQGKGSALRTAISMITGDLALVQDADLEYDPQDYPALLQPLLSDRADAVFGSRFLAGRRRRVLLYKHAIANRALTSISNWFTDLDLTDMETCYKVVRSDVLKALNLKSKRFGIEPELTVRLAQWGARIYEVPISYDGRTYAEGKKIGWRDGVEALWTLVRFRFFDTRFTNHDGFFVLQNLRRARRFNRWMLSRFSEFVGRRVLEGGSGIGNFSELLLDREFLACAELDPLYVRLLDSRFGHLENVSVVPLDLSSNECAHAFEGTAIDTVICLNVVEHLPDDRSVLRQFFDVLEPGGHCAILVPAHEWLFSKCDEVLGHERRYTRKGLAEVMESVGFEVVRCEEFNRLGVFGWIVNKILRRGHLTPVQMKLYEWLVPIAKAVDWIKPLPGLSVIAVGRKPAGSD